MLYLDLDQEADLGVDTVKLAETFAAIRSEFDIPRRDDLKLRDFPTLNHVIDSCVNADLEQMPGMSKVMPEPPATSNQPACSSKIACWRLSPRRRAIRQTCSISISIWKPTWVWIL
jgi:hypothetical protein